MSFSMLACCLPMWFSELGIIIASPYEQAVARDSDEDYSPVSEAGRRSGHLKFNAQCLMGVGSFKNLTLALFHSLRESLGRRPTATSSSALDRSRSTFTLACSPGFSPAIRFSIVAESPTGLSLMATRTSPSFTPALSAGLPRTTCVIKTPRVAGSLNDSASSLVVCPPPRTRPVSPILPDDLLHHLAGDRNGMEDRFHRAPALIYCVVIRSVAGTSTSARRIARNVRASSVEALEGRDASVCAQGRHESERDGLATPRIPTRAHVTDPHRSSLAKVMRAAAAARS